MDTSCGPRFAPPEAACRRLRQAVEDLETMPLIRPLAEREVELARRELAAGPRGPAPGFEPPPPLPTGRAP